MSDARTGERAVTRRSRLEQELYALLQKVALRLSQSEDLVLKVLAKTVLRAAASSPCFADGRLWAPRRLGSAPV